MTDIVFRKEFGLTSKFSIDEKLQYILSANRLYETVMPDGNYQLYHRAVGWNYRRAAELSLLKEDRREALRFLLLAEREAEKFDALEDFRYTSPLCSRLKYDPEAHSKCWEGSERGMLHYRLGELSGYFEGSAEWEEFLKLKERLSRATKGEAPVQL